MTAGIASLAMLTQTAIKSSLAWSTAGQLGFMLLELGLGLFVLALLHLMAHSLYKAHAFLAAGSIVDVLRAPGVPSRGHLGSATWAILVAISTAATFGIGALFGVTIAKEPALLALGVIVGVAAAQPLLKGWSLQGRWALAARTVPLALGVATLYFLLHKLFITGFAADLGAIPSTASPLEYAFLGLVVTVFLALSLLQTVLVHHDERVWVQRLYIHLYNGLYTDLPIERLIYRLWPARFGSRKLSRESRRSA
jgi:NAD(P)H-quinone oxidoreductase subunit 5